MLKNPKRKGNDYERKIAKLFTEWWGEPFYRTPNSGGLGWQGKKIAGDLITPDNFPFVVECKKEENWNFEQIIEGRGIFYKWWEQVIRDAKKVEKLPLLVFSKNHSNDYIALYKKIYEHMFRSNNLPPSLFINNVIITALSSLYNLNRNILIDIDIRKFMS